MHKKVRRFLAGNRARIEEARLLAADAGSPRETRAAAVVALATFENAQRLLASARKQRGR